MLFLLFYDLYTVSRSIGPLYIPTNVGKGVKALLGNFKGACPLKGLGCDPGKDVKGNRFWRNAYNPALIH